TTDILQVIYFEPCGMRIDVGRFLHRGVVFPQYEHGVRVFRKFRVQGKRCTVHVYGYRSGAGGVHREADDLFCDTWPYLIHARTYRVRYPLDVIKRMLPELIAGSIAI